MSNCTATARVAFDAAVARAGVDRLTRERPSTVQLNMGRRCNMTCRHCHVAAGPGHDETARRPVLERVLELALVAPSVRTLDLTGGAPELNGGFEWLVRQARRGGLEVIDRCNLTILTEPGMEGIAGFLAEQGVKVVASMPCYLPENVDRQRGSGAYVRSVAGLRLLNAAGYGRPGSGLELDLVYNPGGAFLPPPQGKLEADYKAQLRRRGIEFSRLLTIINMPINRFAAELEREGRSDEYLGLLADAFNPTTLGDVMCRTLVSVNWSGTLHDCDFNQVLGLSLGGEALTIWDLEALETLQNRPIATGRHCFGCTAGAGSSCSGALG
jgi:radical SAM/Cys-rich protein